MINNERIVPIQKIDRLSAIGEILALTNTSYTVLKSADVTGNFTVTGSGSAGNFLANQPVKTLDFAAGVTSATVYFIPDYAYAGMKIAGTATTPTETVVADGATLYKAVLSSSTVTITAVTPAISAD